MKRIIVYGKAHSFYCNLISDIVAVRSERRPQLRQGHPTTDLSGGSRAKVIYYDGLGREEQTVMVGGSPAGGSVVSEREYDAKATSAIQVKGIRVEAGLSALGKAKFDGTENVLSKGTIAGEEKIFNEERPVKRSLTLTAPEVAVGIDLAFPRFSRNLTAQVLIGYSYMKAEDEVMERTFDGSRTREELVTCKMTASDLFLEVGLAYSFIPDAKISPVVRGGLEIDNFFSGNTENMKQYHIHTDMTGHKHNTSFGAYLGAGADFAIGRHTMRLMAGVKGIGIVGNVWDFSSYSPEIRLGWLF